MKNKNKHLGLVFYGTHNEESMTLYATINKHVIWMVTLCYKDGLTESHFIQFLRISIHEASAYDGIGYADVGVYLEKVIPLYELQDKLESAINKLPIVKYYWAFIKSDGQVGRSPDVAWQIDAQWFSTLYGCSLPTHATFWIDYKGGVFCEIQVYKKEYLTTVAVASATFETYWSEFKPTQQEQ